VTYGPDEPIDPNAWPRFGPPGDSAAPRQPSAPHAAPAQPYQLPPPSGPPGTYAPGWPPNAYAAAPGYPYPTAAGYPGWPAPAYPPAPPYGTTVRPRPGAVTAAAVLAHVTAGLLLVAALLLLATSSLVDGVDTALSGSSGGLTAELAVDAVINVAAATLLISGGVMASGRRPSGRGFLMTGSMLVLGEGLYWIVRGQQHTLGWALIFGLLAGVTLALLFTPAARSYLANGAGNSR
jgi:hypothetical protein